VYIDQMIRIIWTSDDAIVLRRPPVRVSAFRSFCVVARPVIFLDDCPNQRSQAGARGTSNCCTAHASPGKSTYDRRARCTVPGSFADRAVTSRKTNGQR
jgi:hypothetical protein